MRVIYGAGRFARVLTGTGVCFAHGSNDGQKGMGLIMLILIGTVPTAYALNKAVSPAETQSFIAVAHEASARFAKYSNSAPRPTDAREDTQTYVRTRQLSSATLPAVQQLTDTIASQISKSRSLAAVLLELLDNVRNNRYLICEAIRLMEKAKTPVFAPADPAVIDNYKQQLDHATKFIRLG